MSKMETPASDAAESSAEATEAAADKKGRFSTQPKPAVVLAVDACANLFKKNMAKFADMSGGFRSLSDLMSFKKGAGKN